MRKIFKSFEEVAKNSVVKSTLAPVKLFYFTEAASVLFKIESEKKIKNVYNYTG